MDSRKKFGIVDKGDRIHIVPGAPVKTRESLREYLLGKGIEFSHDHDTNGYCWCGPKEETLESGRVMVIHHVLP
jgi:hypothetical protein